MCIILLFLHANSHVRDHPPLQRLHPKKMKVMSTLMMRRKMKAMWTMIKIFCSFLQPALSKTYQTECVIGWVSRALRIRFFKDLKILHLLILVIFLTVEQCFSHHSSTVSFLRFMRETHPSSLVMERIMLTPFASFFNLEVVSVDAYILDDVYNYASCSRTWTKSSTFCMLVLTLN